MAYAAPDKPSKPDVIYRDGKKIHRGKLAETTNDKVINGFPISELPQVTTPAPGSGVGNGIGTSPAIAGPSCGHRLDTGENECYVRTQAEVDRDTVYYSDPEGARKAAAAAPKDLAPAPPTESTPTTVGRVP